MEMPEWKIKVTFFNRQELEVPANGYKECDKFLAIQQGDGEGYLIPWDVIKIVEVRKNDYGNDS